MKRTYKKVLQLMKELLTENRKVAVLGNTYAACNLNTFNNGTYDHADNPTLNELQKRVYTGNFLAGAQGSVNPGFFR